MDQSGLLTRRLLGHVQSLVDSHRNGDALFDYAQIARDEWIRAMAAALPPKTRVLDVGAGEARYRADFAHCDYKTQDFAQYDSSADPTSAASWTYGDIDYVGDITDIPVDSGSFDVVLCTEVLEHVLEPIRAIQEISRVLTPGGRLYLSAPMRSAIHQAPHHYYGGFTPYFYQAALPAHGLSVDSISAPGGLFRAFQEEGRRVGMACLNMRKNDLNDILSHLINFVFNILFPHVFTKLDDKQKHEGYATGWHVEATKAPATT